MTANGEGAGVRTLNRNAILDLLRRQGPRPKAEIARVTGLSAQAASVIVNELIADGLLKKQAKVRAGVGQPSTPVSLDPSGVVSIGLKVGRRSLEAVAIDFTGGVIRHESVPYEAPIRDAVRARAMELAPDMIARLGPELGRRIVGIGLAMPGHLHEWAPKIGLPPGALDDWRETDLRAEIEAATGLPVALFNDATAACAAEMDLGAAITRPNAVYLYVGAFVGGAVVIGGRLHQGPGGNAGAFASLPYGGAGGQLLEHASAALLERMLANDRRLAGLTFEAALLQPHAQAQVDHWIFNAAAALAFAAVSGAAVIEAEEVVIDTLLPGAIKARLLAATEAALGRTDRAGLSPFRLVAGTVGAPARALGAAALPIVRAFSPTQEPRLWAEK